MKDKILTIDDIDLFVFDFDGVLTDNLVYTDQNKYKLTFIPSGWIDPHFKYITGHPFFALNIR